MTMNEAKQFQERVAREGIALLALFKTDVDVSLSKQAVSLIGKAWNIPAETTQHHLDNIAAQQTYADTGAGQPVYSESELPINATGQETLDTLWKLFETAIRLEDRTERAALFNTANELAQAHGLSEKVSAD